MWCEENMASLKNAIPRRTHKERSQPAHRAKHGLLEKKKDYIERARDYERKTERIKSLRKKTYERNPDEFYFGMINTQTEGGVHVAETQQQKEKKHMKHTHIQKLKNQDLRCAVIVFVRVCVPQHTLHKCSLVCVRVRVLCACAFWSAVLHCVVACGVRSYLTMKQSMDAKKAARLQDNLHFLSEESVNKHTVFMDDEAQVNEFDAAEHFDTDPRVRCVPTVA